MATVPIVTEVTKAQLDALVAASGLNEGLQYSVTDKDWLLVATGVNTLMTQNGVLTVLASENVPSYINTERLIIDTGVINYSITNAAGPFMITTDITDFIPTLLKCVPVETDGNGIILVDAYGFFANPNESELSSTFYCNPIAEPAIKNIPRICAGGVSATNTVRFYTYLTKF